MSKFALKILLIESSEADYLTVKNLLQQINDIKFIIKREKVYQKALLTYTQTSYDVCFLSEFISENTGYEFLQTVQPTPERNPIIFLTQTPQPALEEQVIEAGASDCLAKTELSASVLKRSLRYILQQQQLLKQLNHQPLEQAQTALKESEERFQLIFDQAAVGIAQTALNGQFIRVNQRFCEIVGYTRPELETLYFQQLTHPDDLQHCLDCLGQLLEGPLESFSVEKRYLRKDGNIVWVQTTISLCHQTQDSTRKPKYFIGVVQDISERKQMEREQQRLSLFIEQQAQKLDEILSASPDQFYLANVDGVITYASLAASQMFHRPQAEIIGHSWQQLDLPHPIPEQLVTHCNQLLLTGQPQSLDFSLTTQQGSHHYECILSPIHNQARQVESVVATVRDITEHKRALLTLSQTQKQQTLLLNSAPVALFRSHATVPLQLTWVSENVERLFGFSQEKFLAEPQFWASRLHLEDRPRVLEAYQTLEANYSATVEYRWQCADGEERWFLEKSVKVLDDAGQLPEKIGVWIDITDRKQAEMAATESESRFRQLADNIDQVFWVKSIQENRLLYISPAFEKIFGRPVSDILENPEDFLELLHPDDRLTFVEIFNQHQLTENQVYLEYQIMRPDGEQCWIGSRRVQLFNESGEVYRIAGIAEDITDRKKAEAEILNALSQERELRELKSRFISIVSHEFRTPLSTIISSADLLEYYEEKFPSQQQPKKLEHLGRIQTAVVRMTELLEDVVFISRSEEGRLPFFPSPLEIGHFCQELMEEIQACANHKYSLIYHSSSTEIYADVDEKMLRQILSNLLLNAIKYSPDGGQIELKLGSNQTEVIFEVKDQGIGILEEDRPHLFEAFHRGQNVDMIPGTGLGLTVVQQCVEIHGGRILLQSGAGVANEDRGTTFTIILPLKQDAFNDKID